MRDKKETVRDCMSTEVSPSYTINRDPPEIRAYLQAMTVGSAMTRDPLFVYPDMPLVRAAKLVRDCRVGSLPVVESERLVGILSISDLLDVFIEQNES